MADGAGGRVIPRTPLRKVERRTCKTCGRRAERIQGVWRHVRTLPPSLTHIPDPYKTKRTPKRTSLMRQADALWSQLVKAGGVCAARAAGFAVPGALCGGPLDAAHVVPRRHRSTRWLVENGRALCRSHHSLFGGNEAAWRSWIGPEWERLWTLAQKRWDKAYPIADLQALNALYDEAHAQVAAALGPARAAIERRRASQSRASLTDLTAHATEWRARAERAEAERDALRADRDPTHGPALMKALGRERTQWNARKTHCVRGHEFTPENIVAKKGGRRACRTCRNEDLRRLRTRQREARGGLPREETTQPCNEHVKGCIAPGIHRTHIFAPKNAPQEDPQ